MTPEEIAREIVMRVYETPDAQLSAIATAIRTEREARVKAEAERDEAVRDRDLFQEKLRWHRGNPARAEVARLREALERQCDNMAFVINHASLPDQWADKFTRELEEDRAALTQEPKP